MVAKVKLTNNEKLRIPIEVPLLYTIEGLKLQVLILEITFSYDGG